MKTSKTLFVQLEHKNEIMICPLDCHKHESTFDDSMSKNNRLKVILNEQIQSSIYRN